MRTTRQEFAAYIGIDWADQKHEISLSRFGFICILF